MISSGIDVAARFLQPVAESTWPKSPLAGEHSCANVLGIAVEAIDMEGALERVAHALGSNRKGYVCAIGVHGILEARRNAEVACAFAEAAIAIPDGAPTVWVGRLQGHRGMSHVTGPALMREIFKRDEFASFTHFFYGGKKGVAEELAAKMAQTFPHARILGTYTPPFRDLTPGEEAGVVNMIAKLKPDMVWVGISTPKQELFMRRMLPRLDTRLMLGVGAAFDFHTGLIRDCAEWIKRSGFQWLHRLVQDPRRLGLRNLINLTFLWHIALQLTGLKTYATPAWPSSSLGNRRLSASLSRATLDPARTADQICSDD